MSRKLLALTGSIATTALLALTSGAMAGGNYDSPETHYNNYNYESPEEHYDHVNYESPEEHYEHTNYNSPEDTYNNHNW
jgi:hypothetical protein